MDQDRRPWWVFYPIRGLDISNKRYDLNNPMFGDATIISQKHIDQVLLLMKSKGLMEANDVPQVLQRIEQTASNEDFQSFIAVRRTGTVSLGDRGVSAVGNSADRAHQIAALLTLVFLAWNSSEVTCGLVGLFEKRVQFVLMLSVEQGGYLSSTIRDRKSVSVNRLSRGELKRILFQKRFLGLSQILASQQAPLPKSLRGAIIQAAIRLAAAVHTALPSSRLLGAMTAIEILLTYWGDSYKAIEQRLVALLGMDVCAQYDVQAVLKARHSYVHNGEEPSYELSIIAVGLALSCLLRYAETAPKFDNKPILLGYLDLVFKADALSTHWDEMEQEAVGALLRHKRKGYQFPFLDAYLAGRGKKPLKTRGC